MPRRLLQPDLRVPSRERLGELIGRLTDGLLDLSRQPPSSATAVLAQPGVADPAQPEELQRLLSASVDDNRFLMAQIRRLETAQRRSSAELARLRGQLRGALRDALTDPLTGLANRRAFDLELEAVEACASGSSSAHLAIVDIDHFKRVNDAHGHDVGDQVLRIVGEILLAKIRRESVVARLGGDEFGLLLPGAGPHYTVRIAMRLCELLASRPLVMRGDREVSERITLSIGVAGWHAGESSARWYARADAALYRAKRSGRNRVEVDRRQRAVARALPAEASEAALPAATNRG
jgi:diguanylate cyclase